jgi:hypothetical protein
MRQRLRVKGLWTRNNDVAVGALHDRSQFSLLG